MLRSIGEARFAVVGPYTWFSNHFPERWQNSSDTLCMDVDEFDYRFLICVANYRPNVTLFYRPELYPRHFVEMIPGKRLAFLSEPIPVYENGDLKGSSETDLRLAVYKGMSWSSFHKVFYYDVSKRQSAKYLGFPIDDFRPMPIDTSAFFSVEGQRDIDICFIGKATPHRIAQMDFLRTAGYRFVWVAHGVTGWELAELFRRSKVVLNIHADGLPAMEPRIWLAAACGCVVLTEPVPVVEPELTSSVIVFNSWLSVMDVKKAVARFENRSRGPYFNPVLNMSVREFLSQHLF